MRVFVASNMPTEYPYKLQKPATASGYIRETADQFIFDSGIGDDTTNGDVLDLAHKHDADFVIACDVLHDFKATADNVAEFFDLYAGHPCEATPMIPVQCDPQSGRWHSDHLPMLPDADRYVLGGMAVPGVSTDDAIASIERFRAAVGDDAYIHALGIGGGFEIIRRIGGTGLIDSVDCSTPEQAAMNGAVINGNGRQQEVLIFSDSEGKNRRTVPLAEFNAWQIADAWDRASKPSTLSDWS